MAKDYYEILGLPRGASKEEIKKAFHRLAHKHHPDKGGDEAKFKEINEAYQTLSNERKKAEYDQFGATDGFNFSNGGGFSAQGAAPAGGRGPASGWDFSNFGGPGSSFQFDFGDLFENFFGAGETSRRSRRGRDISVDIQISFAEAVFGAERKVLITKVGSCDACAGRGAKTGSNLIKCVTCSGRGQVRESRRSIFGAINAVRTCAVCGGSGEVPEKSCPICGGEGVTKKTEEVVINVPAGIQDGEMIRLANRGEAVPRGLPGDLYVRIHVEKHSVFRRDGSNLLMDLPIKLSDSLLGAVYPIKTLESEMMKVKIPSGITHGEMLRLRGRGVPIRAGRRGDLLIKIIIRTPTKLSKKAKTIIEELQKEGF